MSGSGVGIGMMAVGIQTQTHAEEILEDPEAEASAFSARAPGSASRSTCVVRAGTAATRASRVATVGFVV